MGEDEGYEYKVIRVARYKLEKTLNTLAGQGWELVDTQKKGALAFGSGKLTLTLRRPR